MKVLKTLTLFDGPVIQRPGELKSKKATGPHVVHLAVLTEVGDRYVVRDAFVPGDQGEKMAEEVGIHGQVSDENFARAWFPEMNRPSL